MMRVQILKVAAWGTPVVHYTYPDNVEGLNTRARSIHQGSQRGCADEPHTVQPEGRESEKVLNLLRSAEDVENPSRTGRDPMS